MAEKYAKNTEDASTYIQNTKSEVDEPPLHEIQGYDGMRAIQSMLMEALSAYTEKPKDKLSSTYIFIQDAEDFLVVKEMYDRNTLKLKNSNDRKVRERLEFAKWLYQNERLKDN